MKTITATVPAYMSEYNSIDRLEKTYPDSAISQLMLTNIEVKDWIWIGSASVTVEIAEDKEIKAGLVESLKNAKKKIQADAEKSITEIDAKIQSLLAIEYKPCQTTEG